MVLNQYITASDLLDAHAVMATPAEIHGVLTGLLCGGCSVQRDEWLSEFFELVNDGHPMPAAVTGGYWSCSMPRWLGSLIKRVLNYCCPKRM